MYYIVFDLEFNQDFSSPICLGENVSKYPFEIIQIGAIKLDSNLHTVDSFNQYVKPTIYSHINSHITELTGITTEQLVSEETFPSVFNEYMNFISEKDSYFCIWGASDVKELYRNASYHNLDMNRIPEMFINIQPYVSMYLKVPETRLLKLQTATQLLNIPQTHEYHNALYDAYYTAEIFKKINSPYIQPKKYDPNYVRIRPSQPRKKVDYDMLLQQFRKMYDRELSKDEQDMITLAYKMGKTNQFLK
ncbi:3'-5' exonuclease [Anaeromicropila herbilytica]|uniref:Ribonuclease n=1 Tax=Anaeromicropila herbilytica TaxID=2785025 RepID=A0A7R7IDR3_9FIRM|nr:3'-5' exonuclease [Anaeromicropila herbilytica]BCN30278.1 ribonuclease [Anaeromicropila herbilytica]